LTNEHIYFKLFWMFFKISSITLGGGYAMVPVYRDYIVKKYGLMKDEDFLTLLAQAQSVPGPIAINSAILIGKKLAGIPGLLISSISVIIPPFTVILIVSFFFQNIIKYKYVKYFLHGVNIGITAVLIKMVYDFMKVHFKKRFIVSGIIIVALLIAFLNLPAILLFLIFTTIIFLFQGPSSKLKS
jgi:chromate transporter